MSEQQQTAPEPPPNLPNYRQGQLAYRVDGAPRRPLSDLYFHLMRAPLWQLLGLSFVAYVAAIGAFAALYLLGGDCIENAQAGSALDAFWFSVHTFSTIGYGTMSPATPYANAVATVESWLGLIGVAGVTALIFNKFARPTVRLRFAEAPVVCKRHGVPSLQVRVANERTSGLVDVRVELYAMLREITPEGQRMARMIKLPLLRDEVPYFGMGFTAIHVIDEASPLRRFVEGARDDFIAVRVNLTGVELSMLQSVWAMEMYPSQVIRWGHRYVDAIEMGDTPTIVLGRLSETTPEP